MYLIVEMHFIPAYMEKLSKGQYTYVTKRTQKYGRQTQYYAHTFNPKPAHGLPFFVKFPSISTYFEKIPRHHIWSQHRQGIYNGMFFVPAQPNTAKENFKIPEVIFGDVNITEKFKRSPQYSLIQTLDRIYDKLHIDASELVHLKNDDIDFTKIDAIKQAGTYFYNSTIKHLNVQTLIFTYILDSRKKISRKYFP